MTKLKYNAIPETAIHQTVGTGHGLLPKELEVTLLYYVTESWLVVAKMQISTHQMGCFVLSFALTSLTMRANGAVSAPELSSEDACMAEDARLAA